MQTCGDFKFHPNPLRIDFFTVINVITISDIESGPNYKFEAAQYIAFKFGSRNHGRMLYGAI